MDPYPAYHLLQAYAEKWSSPPPPILAELTQITQEQAQGSNMLSSPLQGRTLAFLSRLMQPRCIVEVGTYTGYSALCLAEGLLPDGELHTIDHDTRYKALAEEFFRKAGYVQQIHYHAGPAATILPQLPLIRDIDLAFIDADKKAYMTYYEFLVPKLRRGGILIADNVLWKGAVLSPDAQDQRAKALHDFTQHAYQDTRVQQLLLPVRDGLLVMQKQ